MKLLEKYKNQLHGKVAPFHQFKLFRDMEDVCDEEKEMDFHQMNEADRKDILQLAEKKSNQPFPELLASDFIRYWQDGNRSVYENKYFERRHMTYLFALAEAIEGKGRFLSRVMDGVWLICDEPDWVVPAHIDHQYALTPWFKEHNYIDLFAAETGAVLSFVYLLLGKELDTLSPLICQRLVGEVRERILVPFLKFDSFWWMGFHQQSVNNWNPWILSNILFTCALVETDTGVREEVVERAMASLDFFIDGYQTDGGCDEGPSYWTAAGAAMFDALELLYDITDGFVNLFQESLVRKMGEYEADFHINQNYYVNFADCPAEVTPGYRMIARYGRRVQSKKLADFGTFYARRMPASISSTSWMPYRTFKNLFEKVLSDTEYKPEQQCWYNGICVMIERELPSDNHGFFLACKGGHNNESHNHNDVGSFIVYSDGKPLLMDVGVGQYTKKTFSSERYEIWSMCSDYHNLPTVNGCTQLPGREYCAKNVIYSKEQHELSMDIAPAYPEKAGMKSLVRTVNLRDGKVCIKDEIDLKQQGQVVFSLMCGQKPSITSPGIVQFPGGVILRYSDGLTAVVDDFDVAMEDNSIQDGWGDVEIQRLLLSSKSFTSNVFQISIERI